MITKKPRKLAPWATAFPAQHAALRPTKSTATAVCPECGLERGHRILFKTGNAKATEYQKALSAKRIKPKSAKLAKSDRIYHAMAKDFLELPENSYCRVEFYLTGRKIPATCVHHLRGRHRTLKFDRRFWCPTSYGRSLWPHENISEARAAGLIALAGDWNKEPGDEETKRILGCMQDNKIV